MCLLSGYIVLNYSFIQYELMCFSCALKSLVLEIIAIVVEGCALIPIILLTLPPFSHVPYWLIYCSIMGFLSYILIYIFFFSA